MYNIGLYGGSFNPLHMGHVQMILQNAAKCREFFIVLSVGVNRDEIDYKIRYRWLYQVTKHLDNVKIIVIKDDAKSKEEYDDNHWKQGAEYVKLKVGKHIDVVFIGSDYNNDSAWHKCYADSKIVILDRTNISSSEIRLNPYKQWDNIPSVVKPYYVKRVMITGSESVGKSTLTINLAKHFNTNYIDEVGRDISARSGTDMLMISEDFTEILLRHKLNEIEAVEHSNKVLFVDTDTLVTKFYMSFIGDYNIDKNKALADAISDINDYDLILFLEPDVAFIQDGDRSEVIESDREFYSSQIKILLDKSGKKYECVSGSYAERTAKAIELVEALLQSS